jgi:hypothetical protein
MPSDSIASERAGALRVRRDDRSRSAIVDASARSSASARTARGRSRAVSSIFARLSISEVSKSMST